MSMNKSRVKPDTNSEAVEVESHADAREEAEHGKPNGKAEARADTVDALSHADAHAGTAPVREKAAPDEPKLDVGLQPQQPSELEPTGSSGKARVDTDVSSTGDRPPILHPAHGHLGINRNDNSYFSKEYGEDEEGNRTSKHKRVTNFTVDMLAVERHDEDGISFQCELRLDGEVLARPLTLSPKHFAEPRAFNEAIITASDAKARFLGQQSIVKVIDVIKAVEAPRAKHIRVVSEFGWFRECGYFCSPSLTVDRAGNFLTPDELLELGVRCDSSNTNKKSRFLDLKFLNPERLRKVLKHVVRDHPSYAGPERAAAGLAHVFLALIQADWESDFNPFTLQFAGTTGLGKTEYAQALQCFFGNFTVRSRIMSWTSTPNAVHESGASFKDALFLADDYKTENLSREGISQAKRIIQGYADRRGRGRSGYGGGKNDVPPIAGMLLITGEDIPERSASTLARVLVVDFNGVVQTDERDAAWHRIKEYRIDYAGVTSAFLSWYGRTDRRENFRGSLKTCVKELEGAIPRSVRQNRNRIIQNLALSLAGFSVFLAFARANDALTGSRSEDWSKIYFDYLVSLASESHEAVQEQRLSAIFVSYFRTLLVRGDSTQDLGIVDSDGKYDWVDFPLLLLTVRKEAARAREPVSFSDKRLKDELIEDGYVIPEADPSRSKPRFGSQKKVKGKKMRLARFVRAKLEGEAEEE